MSLSSFLWLIGDCHVIIKEEGVYIIATALCIALIEDVIIIHI